MEAVLDSLGIISLELTNGAHTNDGVHGSPDIVAHTGQEIALCVVCRVGRRQSIPKQLLLPGLFRPLSIQHLDQHDA